MGHTLLPQSGAFGTTTACRHVQHKHGLVVKQAETMVEECSAANAVGVSSNKKANSI